jgi:ribosome biogenesis GTPase
MDLKALGWNHTWEERFRAFKERGLAPARVAVEHRNRYVLYAPSGEITATLAGRVRHESRSPGDFPAVGDWVAVEAGPDGTALVQAVLTRSGAFTRKATGERTVEDVLAANVDVSFIVASLSLRTNTRRLERYLALCWESASTPVLVLTKADLCQDPQAARREVERIAMGVPVHLVSALTGTGLDELRPYASGSRTVALLGPSGVGKSTLINALLGADRQKTGGVGRAGKGRHTTTRRELVPFPGGGFLLDTPGLRELQLWGEGDGVKGTFGEIADYAEGCRFRDCGHLAEPGCAVLAALEAGELPRERYESYVKLKAELESLEARRDQFARLRKSREARAANRAPTRRLDDPYG